MGPQGQLSTLYISYHCLLASMVFNEKLVINLIDDHLYGINFLLLLSQLSFVFDFCQVTCDVSECVLEFVEFLRSVVFLLNSGSFQRLFLQTSFLPFSLFLLPLVIPQVYVCILNDVPQVCSSTYFLYFFFVPQIVYQLTYPTVC